MSLDNPLLRTIIAAQPGWVVVMPLGGGKVHRVPVIAWLIEAFEKPVTRSSPDNTFTSTTPLTVHGEHNDYALEFSGAVFTACEDFSSVADFLGAWEAEQ
jgi:hypothetical protein